MAEMPSGLWLSGDGPALRRVLVRAARAEPLPVGREAAGLLARVKDCAYVRGSAPDGDWLGLLASIACGSASDDLVAVARLRGGADLVLGAGPGAQARLVGRAHVADDGSLRLDALLDPGKPATAGETGSEAGSAGKWGGAAALLIPSGDPAGKVQLDPRDTLIHGRFRPAGGLDIASLVPEGSQGDQLFRLKSELFAGAVLDGTWEVAVWMPESSAAMPPLALALGYRLRSAASAAVDRFLADLRRNWPIHPRETRFADRDGGCLDDLRLLPELAPCWAFGEDALVIGWNAASVERALSGGEGRAGGEGGPAVAGVAADEGPGPEGGVVLNLDRLPEADRRLQQVLAPAAEPFAVDYGWSRLLARASPGDGALQLHVELQVSER